MNIGDLRHRVTLRIPIDTTSIPPDYTDGATVWAAVQPLRGREFFQAQANQNESTVKITMRYRKGINSDFQIRFNNDGVIVDYEITNIIDKDMRHEWLEIMCKAVE